MDLAIVLTVLTAVPPPCGAWPAKAPWRWAEAERAAQRADGGCADARRAQARSWCKDRQRLRLRQRRRSCSSRRLGSLAGQPRFVRAQQVAARDDADDVRWIGALDHRQTA